MCWNKITEILEKYVLHVHSKDCNKKYDNSVLGESNKIHDV